MSYLLLIVEPRGQREGRSEAEGRARYAEMLHFGESLAARGLLLAGESLRPDRHGVRVQQRDDRPVLRDGPFAEAKEMVGGFFLVSCASQEQAVALACESPAARWATVEVRETAPCHRP